MSNSRREVVWQCRTVVQTVRCALNLQVRSLLRHCTDLESCETVHEQISLSLSEVVLTKVDPATKLCN
jgi:hypothetical protein